MRDPNDEHPRLHIAEPAEPGRSDSPRTPPDTNLGCGWGCLIIPLVVGIIIAAIAFYS